MSKVYSSVAIQTSLMLRTAFRMALRQAEELLGSVITLMGLNLSAPDHTTVSRRAVTLPRYRVKRQWGR
ncbi:transposase [Burkholderia sp. HI2714]|uniref:transposase n=1 Tax=Burkholderia sp. HI2714 TaxID=2015359 RepID=UPI0015C5B59E|nr:transposase [Burkholderia sp. HI2714]